MTKRLFFFVGLLLGLLLAAFLQRPKLQRLATLEAKETAEKERLDDYDRQWREEVAMLPFEERMEYELWEAGMRLNNWMPDVDTDAEDDDEET